MICSQKSGLLKQTKVLLGKSCRTASHVGWHHHLHGMRCTNLASPQCHLLIKSRGSSSLAPHRCLVFSKVSQLPLLSNQPLSEVSLALGVWLGKSCCLSLPLNFTSWLNNFPFKHSEHSYSCAYCLAPLHHRMQLKTRFYWKPSIILKTPLSLQFSSVSIFQTFSLFLHGQVHGAHCGGTTAPHHQRDAPTWPAQDSQQGWYRAGAPVSVELETRTCGADSQSCTLKYNVLISRSACSCKSNGFHTDCACQWSRKLLQLSLFSHIQPMTLSPPHPPHSRAGLVGCQ